jgi:hypothetical protein
VEGIWIRDLKDGFEFEKLINLNWNDLKNPEKLRILKDLFRNIDKNKS